MLTWYSLILPPASQRTCCSLIHAPRTLRSVFAARVRPCWIASSKLLVDVALSSDTLATDMGTPSVGLEGSQDCDRDSTGYTPPRRRDARRFLTPEAERARRSDEPAVPLSFSHRDD